MSGISRNRVGRAAGLDTAVPALVMRLDDNIFHHGTLAVVRSLGRAGVEVHAVLEGRHAPVSRSRYLNRMHTWQGTERTPAALVAELGAMAERIGRRALLIPVDDQGAIIVAEHAAALEPSFLLPRQSPTLPRRLADKAELAELCRRLGIAQPETRVIATLGDVASAVARLGLPLMAKWARPWLLPKGARLRSTSLVQRREQAVRLLGQAGGHGSKLLFQRFVPDSPGSDWFFHGYFDENSSCLFGGTGRKERAYPARSGLTTFGRWLDNPTLEAVAHELGRALGYRGVLDLDFRHDPRSDAYYLLDFNPRLGAQFGLFRDGDDLDVVRALHLDLTGRQAGPPRAAYGRTYLVENYDTVPALYQRRSREITWRQWWGSVRGADELAWFSADDPRPFVAMGGQTLKRAFTRLSHRNRNG
ncbi:ATP-grasp domain-containing protein [Nonomuraea sp. NPDC046570]|uniref:carboxylate--amine ligase n=1 Tax=Nonomuraea sp. NPDC046570 TaxID=3155255 RepID=UPI0033CFCBCF